MGTSIGTERAALPVANRRLAAVRGWRPSLRVAVAGASLTIVIAMAVVIANLVADRLRELAIDAALEHAESVVRANLDPALAADALQPGAIRDPALDDQLELLVQGGGMSRVVIWSPDGRAVYSSDPALRGRVFDVDGDLGEALQGISVAEYGTATEDAAAAFESAALPVD